MYCLNWSNHDFFYLCGYLLCGAKCVRLFYFVSCTIDVWHFGIEVCYDALIYVFGEGLIYFILIKMTNVFKLPYVSVCVLGGGGGGGG